MVGGEERREGGREGGREFFSRCVNTNKCTSSYLHKSNVLVSSNTRQVSGCD